MTFHELKEFISRRMKMSHVYQPVMLKTLLKHGGICHERQIAESILAFDDSQIEYYVSITNNMVGKVLRRHGIVEREAGSRLYRLRDFEQITVEQVEELTRLCDQRLEEFLEKRGERVFAHRRKSEGYIPGTIRYEVLKRARFRCELCGISAEEKALEVDHIIPRNLKGEDDPSNYQALCYARNATKRDQDQTDFRGIPASYDVRKPGCPFCDLRSRPLVAENTTFSHGPGYTCAVGPSTSRAGPTDLKQGSTYFRNTTLGTPGQSGTSDQAHYAGNITKGESFRSKDDFRCGAHKPCSAASA